MKKGFGDLPAGEREVCKRFKIARQEAGITQDRIGIHIGLTRNQVANIESCRVPLRFWAGWKFCSELDVNAAWLATESGPLRPCVDFFKIYTAPPTIESDFEGNEQSFAEGFAEISLRYSELFQDQGFKKRTGAGLRGDIQRAVHSGGLFHRKAIALLVEGWMNDIPPDHRDDFVAFLCEAADKFLKSDVRKARKHQTSKL